MSKVLILANASDGLYDFRNELVEKLLAENQVMASVPDEVKTKELLDEGCMVVHTPINRRGINPIEDIRLFFHYCKLIRREKPDLVLTYTIKPNVYGGFCCRVMRVPYIVTITGLGSAFQKKGLLLHMVVIMYRMGLKKAECVFFQNKENRSIFESFKIKGKSSRLVKGSGVNLERHKKEQYPLESPVKFLYVGRMMREKGIMEFLAAAKQLHNDQIHFELLGTCDEDLQDVLDEAERNGSIRQLGFDPQVHPYLKECSALILPSYHEGMSNVLMEASAVGRPVIATNISGCREIFEEGVTGFGCEPGSAEGLMKAIEKFLALSPQQRAAMGQKAREKMEREFDRQKVVQEYLKEIQKSFNKEVAK